MKYKWNKLLNRQEIPFLKIWYITPSIWLQRFIFYLFVLSNSISTRLRWFQLVMLTLTFHNPGILWSLRENEARYMLCFRHNEWHKSLETQLELAIIVHDLKRHHPNYNHAQNLARLWQCWRTPTVHLLSGSSRNIEKRWEPCSNW